jgi:LacI family transcriptional regulator
VKKKSSMPTVADVARLAGVGANTVSRVVNGASYVSLEKKKKIQAAINKLGYSPNQAARILKGQRARIIGLIVPDLADIFFGKCASAIEEFASARLHDLDCRFEAQSGVPGEPDCGDDWPESRRSRHCAFSPE